MMTTAAELLTSLHKVLECPVCLETLKVPFKQCVRGHLMCSDCVQALAACPICQGDFSIENPVGVKNLLEALPKFCRFSDKGCTLVLEQGNDHEGFCGFRPVACRKMGCQVVVPLCEILKHYKSAHPTQSIVNKINENINRTNFHPKIKRTDNLPVELFENFFWIVSNNDVDKKQLKFEFQAKPNGKPLYDYFVRITFEQENCIYTNTMKACISSSIHCEEEEEEKNEDGGEQREEILDDLSAEVMRIPQRALNLFIDEEGALKFKLFFYREKIE